MTTTASPAMATVFLALLAVVSASAIRITRRQDTTVPALQGGFTSHCDFYQVISHGEAYGHLQAQCNLDPADPDTEIASTLDLNLCMGNYNNNLAWGYLGGAFASCTGCRSREFATRYLDCDCGSVDLNDGIYVTSSGAVACYDRVGSSYNVPYKKE